MVHVSSEWALNVAYSYLVRCSPFIFFKELFINVEIPLRNKPQFELFKHVDEDFPINEFNGRDTIPSCFFLGFERECAGGNNKALVRATHHCATKISNLGWSYRSLIPLALEQNVEADKGIYLKCSDAVDPPIIALTRYRDMLEPGLPEESLT